MTHRVDVAIVGGGVVGAALAFGMRASGARIAVLDAHDPSAPSRNNFGLVWLQGKGAGSAAYAAWTLESVRAWPALARALHEATGSDVALEQEGGVHVCATSDALHARRRAFDALFDAPGMPRYDVAWLDGATLREAWPWQGSEAAGATYCPLDGHCDSGALGLALRGACTSAGVDWIACRVDRVEAMDARFRLAGAGVVVDAGRVVIAAGLDSMRLAAMVGVVAPLRAVKGHVLALDAATRMRWPAETLRSTGDGRLLAGDSHEDRADAELDAAVLAAIARRTLRLAPALADVRVAGAWAACRVMSPDGLPVYAQSQRFPGAFVVTSHSGVTLAAVHAMVLAPSLVEGRVPERLAGFDARRFGPDGVTARSLPVAPVVPVRNLARATLADVARWPTSVTAMQAVCRDEA